MSQTESGKVVTDGLTEEGYIVLGSTLLENGHIVHGILWDLIGSISSTSNVTGTLSASREIIGTVSANSSLSGTLSRVRPLAAAISSTTSISGSLTKYIALTGGISALSAPRLHIMRRRAYPTGHQVRLFDVTPGVLSMQWSLKGTISATSSLSGALSVNWSLKGAISSTSSVSGSIIESTYLTGSVSANSAISGSLTALVYIAGAISATSSLQGILSHVAPERGFYYAKLGSTILTGLEKDSFRITEELNKIPSFEFEIANCSDNRTTIAAGITDTFTIYRRINDVDVLMFTGLLNGDTIEYLSLERIRVTGYASYVDLNWRLHQHLNSADAENVDKVWDYSGSYTDYTTAANNDTINDVTPTFTSEDDALYIGQSEQFFSAQVKYSTKGVTYAHLLRRGSCTTCQQVRFFPYGADELWETVIYEYSKGGSVWATLDVLDETRAFTEDPGTYFITIAHKPSDWAKETVNGVKKFWIRARLTMGGIYNVKPEIDRIKMTNVNVYTVYYFETAANTIMDEILAGTGYSMDVTDACPSDEISIVAEYETKLRMIPGVANALTWDDNGDKKGYQWWIDTSKKVHFKQERGSTHGDITSELTILNNVKDYFNLTNRIHFLGNYDGLNQLRAVIENTNSQDTHEIRELAVPEERYNNYIPLKEAAQKAMTYTKAPLGKIAATLKTKYWLDNTLEVGDTVTLHQDTWNVDSTAFQIVRADIGPRATNLDLGISQEHLDGLKAGLQRQMDISGIRMHGSTTLLQFGPETMNYQRVDDATVYPAHLKFEIPSDARYIHKILVSWKLGPYRADVSGGEESEGHDHTGTAGAGGAHNHAGYVGAGGAHDSEVLDGGVHTPTELGEAHSHSIATPVTMSKTIHTNLYPPTSIYVSYESGHSHTNPSTGNASQVHTHTLPSYTGAYDTDDEWVADDLTTGTACASGYCITGVTSVAVPSTTHWHHLGGSTNANSVSHTHTQGSTGTGSQHRHTITSLGPINLLDGNLDAWLTADTTADDSPAHAHTINEVVAHPHTAVAIAAHANHVIGNQIAHGDHSIVTQAAAMIDLVLGIVEIAGGTTMQLTVNGEDVTTIDGDGTDIVITGYCNPGSNTVELYPIVGSNTKGGATLEARGIIFIESSKF